MNNLQICIKDHLNYCANQKRLDTKTLKAYRIDLKQFSEHITSDNVSDITSRALDNYISELNQKYKPKTVKRKVASVKAFFHYLEYQDLININPFNKIQIKFREPITLPKIIPLCTVEHLLSTIYQYRQCAKTDFQRNNALRDAAVTELLFATGIRVSELCSLKINDVNLYDKTVLIWGKGSKERKIHIGNNEVLETLEEYKKIFIDNMEQCNHFFVNQNGTVLSDQSIRRMINKYCYNASIDLHITPHMFRHTFATSLLEADVDIRYIQEMLGHSSINITEIYTHVDMAKQRDILSTKHPRKNFKSLSYTNSQCK